MENKTKLGGGCFLTSYIKKYKTVEKFVEANLDMVSSFPDPKGYLEAVWDIANRDEKLRTKAVEMVKETIDEVVPETPVVKKPSIKKKASTKKE